MTSADILVDLSITNNSSSSAESQNIVISEVQTGTSLSAGEEFVEIYNNGDESLNLTGWSLEYKSATGENWSKKAELSGEFSSNEYVIASTENYLSDDNILLSGGLAASGGHIRLVKPLNNEIVAYQVIDLVGWGTVDSPETSSAEVPDKDYSIQRCQEEQVFVDTDNNFDDFKQYSEINPGSGIECAAENDFSENDGNLDYTNENKDPATVDVFTCEGIAISELLPNAEGSDAGKEFIELYNPTSDFIDLDGCGLQLNGKGTIYRFSGVTLNPEQYISFSDSTTKITLPNSSGGTVYLLSAGDEELRAVTYPGGLDEEQSWSWLGLDKWEKSYNPTPGAANKSLPLKPCPAGQIRSEDTGRCRSLISDNSGLKPCGPGRARNPLTNRCRSILSSEDSLKPCNPDQYRNPETNRCKKKDSGPGYKPCKPGQERNPSTNRCRSTSSAASKLKSCNPGQERNPATNRCRKVVSDDNASVLGEIEDYESPLSGDNKQWWIAGGLALSAGGYGLWEWRSDLRDKLNGLISRLKRK